MTEHTKIEWADHTWNPWIGCTHVHTGCLNCYAERDMDTRLGRVVWGKHGTRVRTSPLYWRKPYQWHRKNTKDGTRQRVFPSLCDPFEDFRGEIRDHGQHALYQSMAQMRADFWKVITETPSLDWLLLTKRPGNVRRMWPSTEWDPLRASELHHLKNVWLLYSASDQKSFNDGLIDIRRMWSSELCPVLGLSLEPLVDDLDISAAFPLIRWVIVGGESGAGARPCHVTWVHSIVEQCRRHDVPCFVKQLGSKPTVKASSLTMQYHVSHPKGGDIGEWPGHLRVREFPVQEAHDASVSGGE